jgi:hypothetical protein
VFLGQPLYDGAFAAAAWGAEYKTIAFHTDIALVLMGIKG